MSLNRLLPCVFVLCACGAPDDAPAPARPVPRVADTTFDAGAWIQRAAVVWDTSSWSASYDSALAASQQFAGELDAALYWTDACDLPADEQTDSTSGTGIMHRYQLGADEYLVSISCQLFAQQATLVIAHVAGPRARLVAAPQFDESGAPADTSSLFVGLEGVDTPTRTLTIFTRARGVGDCGTLASYHVQPDGIVTTQTVRARECIDVREGEVELPEQWPVVFPAP